MTVKSYLNQAYRLDQQINSKIDALDELNRLAVKDTAVFSGMPGSPNRDKQALDDTVCKIVDLQIEINKSIDRLVDLKAEMYHIFQKIENIDYRLILEKRYLCNKSWEEISVDLDIGLRWIYKLHDSALADVEKFLPVH